MNFLQLHTENITYKFSTKKGSERYNTKLATLSDGIEIYKVNLD